ncbi:MAG: Endoribonuclease YbeY [Chlamydiae bacterium]|nr:Endoribonuclease YbeY [Chlamydiota bacterium]
MDVSVNNSQSVVSIQVEAIEPIVRAVLEQENEVCDEVILHFVTEEEISEIHSEFFDDPTTTDCISIQVDEAGTHPRFLGEVFISPQAAIDYSHENGEDLYQELTLYLVHGLLHLIGYKDLEAEDIKEMRLAEKRQMDYLMRHNLLIKK